MLERVAVVSIAPILPGAVHGGSQRVLDGVLRGLADAGAQVRVVCSWRPENDGGFELTPGVTVEPLLRLTGYFPDPWEVAPHRILQSGEQIAPVLDWAESVYLHADTFYLRGLIPADRRVVRSFHDFHYETALISAFGFTADTTIVPSEYLRRCIEASAGAMPGREHEPVVVIPNGIDLQRFRPQPGVAPRGVRERVDGDIVLLWPHRPDARKGIYEAISLTAAISRDMPERRPRLLVPRHVDAATSSDTRAFYDAAVSAAIDQGVMDSLEFTPWWDGDETPAAYNFADITLCPGNFIESFSLVAYESLACGTPVVAASVGALRDLPDHPGVHLVPWADKSAAAAAAMKAIGGMADVSGFRDLIADRYSFAAMKDGYVDAIIGDLPAIPAPPDKTDIVPGFELAPWCTIDGSRIYHDYEGRWSEQPRLANLAARNTPHGRFALSDAREAGIPDDELFAAVADGFIIGT